MTGYSSNKQLPCRAPRSEADMAGNAITDTSLVDVARQTLPFQLTGAQDRALAEILDDMAYPAPMARLLQVQRSVVMVKQRWHHAHSPSSGQASAEVWCPCCKLGSVLSWHVMKCRNLEAG